MPLRIHVIICVMALNVGACSSAASSAETGEWDGRADFYQDVCSILWNGDMSQVAIHSAENELAGMNVHSPSLSFVEIGMPEPQVQITVNGQPLTATVVGARPNVIFLSFDPRPLVERYPTGFEVAVTRQGEVVQRLDLNGAAEAFKNLMECSRTAFN